MSAAQAAVVARPVIDALLSNDAKLATKYLSETETLKVKRIGAIDRRNRRVSLVLTFGTPNYAERAFIKKLKAAGEPFPVKKVQLRFPVKR